MTLCPTSRGLVPTGHRTSTVQLTTMVEPRSFRCAVCAQIHSWRAAEAVVEGVGGEPRPVL